MDKKTKIKVAGLLNAAANEISAGPTGRDSGGKVPMSVRMVMLQEELEDDIRKYGPVTRALQVIAKDLHKGKKPNYARIEKEMKKLNKRVFGPIGRM